MHLCCPSDTSSVSLWPAPLVSAASAGRWPWLPASPWMSGDPQAAQTRSFLEGAKPGQQDQLMENTPRDFPTTTIYHRHLRGLSQCSEQFKARGQVFVACSRGILKFSEKKMQVYHRSFCLLSQHHCASICGVGLLYLLFLHFLQTTNTDELWCSYHQYPMPNFCVIHEPKSLAKRYWCLMWE